jgi:phage terminase large subunit-like protein
MSGGTKNSKQPKLSPEELRAFQELERRSERRRLMTFYGRLFDHSKPFSPENIGVYGWQQSFHNAGAKYAERLLMAANRVGKTQTGAAEMAIHLTGNYPPWWEGRRFEKPIRAWCGSVTNEASKDVVQTALLGPPGQFGTGWIPGALIEGKPSYRQAGVPEVVDRIRVKHVSGGTSICVLKTYEQGRAKWQGTSIHAIWLDEEPINADAMDIYTEAHTRILDVKGVIYMTFTPLLGPSEVVMHFLNATPQQQVYVKNASWEDAPHLDKDERNRLWNSYPPHMRDTRTKGTPLLGSGAIFAVTDEALLCEPIEPKPWWRFINGVDFGIDHPAAGAFCAFDPEGEGTFYVYDCYRAAGETPVYHAAAMKKHGDWIPNAWPHDGLERDKGSGVALKDLYRRQGLRMLKEHAHYPDERGNHTEPGLIEMLEWMRTGRFKVVRTLNDWYEEKRLYHRKDGKVVKQKDDIMAATRYAFIMRRSAVLKPGDAQIGRRAPMRPIVGRARWQGQAHR